jgi:dipeptidase E
VSAGMICWYEQGITDSYQDRMDILPCLSLLPGCGCPHYDSEADRQPLVHGLIQNHTITSCIAVENGAAVHYKNHQFHQSVAFQAGKQAYTVKQGAGKIIEEKHTMVSLI